MLQAHHNELRELPDALGQLSKLQGLYLQSNRLERLASWLEAASLSRWRHGSAARPPWTDGATFC